MSFNTLSNMIFTKHLHILLCRIRNFMLLSRKPRFLLNISIFNLTASFVTHNLEKRIVDGRMVKGQSMKITECRSPNQCKLCRRNSRTAQEPEGQAKFQKGKHSYRNIHSCFTQPFLKINVRIYARIVPFSFSFKLLSLVQLNKYETDS